MTVRIRKATAGDRKQKRGAHIGSALKKKISASIGQSGDGHQSTAVAKTGSDLSSEHINTTVGTLREIYGQNFAKDFDGGTKLKTVIETTSNAALVDFHRQRVSSNKKKSRNPKISGESLKALASATVLLAPALKRLADR